MNGFNVMHRLFELADRLEDKGQDLIHDREMEPRLFKEGLLLVFIAGEIRAVFGDHIHCEGEA